MPAKGRRSSSAAKTDSPKATIKNLFGAKKSEEKEEQGDSPGKTSDYESEASRSTTPAPSTAESSPKEVAVEKEKVKIPSKSGDGKVAAMAKREVKEENDEDAEEEGADVFSQPADEGEEKAEDKVKVKAALQTGLLGKGIAEEEERMAGENRR